MYPLIDNTRLKRRRRKKILGFSLLEVMIATAVLGIAMAALVKMHTASVRGMKSSRDLTIAEDIAHQIADEMSSMDPDALPTAANGMIHDCAAPIDGCRLGGTASRDFAAPKGGTCTTWWGAAGTSRRTSGGFDQGGVTDENQAVAEGRIYRADRVVRAHPDAGARSTVIEVFVCWRDEGQIVRQVSARRVVF